MSDLELLLTELCPNCGKNHEATLFSLAVENFHYIIGDCRQCNYHLEFRVDELGAGILENGKILRPA